MKETKPSNLKKQRLSYIKTTKNMLGIISLGCDGNTRYIMKKVTMRVSRICNNFVVKNSFYDSMVAINDYENVIIISKMRHRDSTCNTVQFYFSCVSTLTNKTLSL